MHFLACSLHITLVLPRSTISRLVCLYYDCRWAYWSAPLVTWQTRWYHQRKLHGRRVHRQCLGLYLSMQSSLCIIASWTHAVNSLGDILSPSLAPLSSLILSLSLWSFRTEVAPLYKSLISLSRSSMNVPSSSLRVTMLFLPRLCFLLMALRPLLFFQCF